MNTKKILLVVLFGGLLLASTADARSELFRHPGFTCEVGAGISWFRSHPNADWMILNAGLGVHFSERLTFNLDLTSNETKDEVSWRKILYVESTIHWILVPKERMRWNRLAVFGGPSCALARVHERHRVPIYPIGFQDITVNDSRAFPGLVAGLELEMGGAVYMGVVQLGARYYFGSDSKGLSPAETTSIFATVKYRLRLQVAR